MFRVNENDLIDMYNDNHLGLSPLVTAAVVWGAVGYLVASPISPGWGLPAVFVATVASIVLYVARQRRLQRRGNSYDPLKPDSELEKTPFSWRRDGLPILAVIIVWLFMNLAQNLNFSYTLALIPAVIFAIASYLIFALAAKFPQPSTKNSTQYIPPATLFAKELAANPAAPRAFEGGNAAVAILHAQGLVPGAYQRTDATIVDELVDAGYDRAAVTSALQAAIAEGRIVQIREMRRRGSDEHWLTLTEKSQWDYQQNFARS